MPSASNLEQICIPMIDQPAYTPRKLRVATIGAGYSGLIFAHKIQHEQPDLQKFIEHVIFEANDGVGGTWKVNTYPGVQNDVPAHLYALPFDPNPNWSKFYADGAEILEYVEATCDKWNLRRDIKFNTKVIDLEWTEEHARWRITVSQNGQERVEMADFVISAQGFLSRWKWPAIRGIHDFTGHKVHSAEWDHAYDYSHKRIGIIGNGSSAIQILPQMAKLDGVQIVSFQRNPTWITQSLGEALGVSSGEPEPPEENEVVGVNMEDVDADDEEIGSNFNPRYTARDKRRFADPQKHKAYRKMLQQGMNRGFKIYRKESVQNKKSTQATIERMRKALNNDEELCRKLIPDWTLGCRRLTPGEGYLESFLLPHVKLTQSHIKGVDATGINTEDGVHHDLDVIICATGFDVSNIPHYPVIGRGGISVAEKWKDEPESYLSLACPDFPNYFIFTGPNATVGHGTLTTSMDWSANYMIKWLRKVAGEGIRSIAPKQVATDEFVRYGDEIHKTLTWTGSCVSWYKNHRRDGRVTATWPGSALLYKQVIQELRPEDWEIEYEKANRFAFLGNGFTLLEMDEEADLAFYI
ncbi:hypothetical protein H2198_000603 [Neophaeococcomyces mojaviensis]|uniref:Uncharacterized protein n=1 Tax=Neophaeococcomyces mojaviensis TaxID=3383035 RepID=A0ACC3AJX1_9EURO|nr:hypothetical protein H2198_000603 [Knufia sp. JES_112]